MLYQAPLRLSIAGGGTDVEPFSSEHGSAVINFAINTEIKLDLRILGKGSPGIEIHFTNKAKLESDHEFSLQLGRALQGIFKSQVRHRMQLVIHNPVGSGSGLGASSTIVALALYALNQEFNLDVTPEYLTSLAFRVERNLMKRAGGFQDYYPAIYGGLNRLEKSASNPRIQVVSLPIAKGFREFVDNSIFCFSLGKQRSGEEVISDQVIRSKNRFSETYRALSAQSELVMKIENSIISGDYELLLDLIDESYAQKKKFSPMITNPIINEMESRVRKLGGRGIKVSGAGGGGYMFSFFMQGVPENIESILAPEMNRLHVSMQDSGARMVRNE